MGVALGTVCDHCGTPLIGSSCYQCGKSAEGGPVERLGDTAKGAGSDRRGGDGPSDSSWLTPSPTASAWLPEPSAARSSDDSLTQFTDGAAPDSEQGGARAVEQPGGGGRALEAIGRLLSGDTITGVITHVSEPGYETGSLANHNASQQAVSGCLAVPFRALGLLFGLLFAPFRFLLGASLMGGRGPQAPDTVQIPVNRFRVEATSGRLVDCYLRGEVNGGGIYLGEEVEALGRFDGRGAFRVRQLRSLTTGSITTGTIDARVRFGTARAILAIAMLLVVIYVLWSYLA